MKKQNLKGLSLNKKSVSNLQQEEVKGGQRTYWSACCTVTQGNSCRCTHTWCILSINECPL